MTAITKPQDLMKPVSQVDDIIKLIEAEFKKNPKMRTNDIPDRPDLLSAYYIITIKGFYSSDDINTVIRRYIDDAGWKLIEVYRSYAERGQTAQLTKFRFYEIY